MPNSSHSALWQAFVSNNATAALEAHQATFNVGSLSSSPPIVQGTEIINIEESDEPLMRTIGGKRVPR